MRFLFALLMIFWVFPLAAQEAPQQDDKTYPTIVPSWESLKKTGSGRVTGVIDALRLQLDDRRIIYLTGLDIPDSYQQEPGELSIAAKELLEKLFLKKKVNIYQNPDPKAQRTNRMGNEIAHITLFDNDLWAQGALIAEGLARVRTTLDDRSLAKEMLYLEDLARKNIPEDSNDEKKPAPPYLWKMEKYKVLNTETAGDAPEGYHVVEGTIKKTAIKNNRIFLNFGNNWRNDFTVGIPPESRRIFSKEKLQPLQWRNKTVRIHGWLEEYNGPYIEVDHPERIEFIDTEQKSAESDMKEMAVPPADKEMIKDALPNINELKFER